MSDLPQTSEALGQLSASLAPALEQLRKLDESRVHAVGDFKSAFARAYRDAPGSVKDREHAAWLRCEPLWRTAELAESAVKMQQAHLKMLYARIDVGRSYFSAQKAEMAFVTSTSGVTP